VKLSGRKQERKMKLLLIVALAIVAVTASRPDRDEMKDILANLGSANAREVIDLLRHSSGARTADGTNLRAAITKELSKRGINLRERNGAAPVVEEEAPVDQTVEQFREEIASRRAQVTEQLDNLRQRGSKLRGMEKRR